MPDDPEQRPGLAPGLSVLVEHLRALHSAWDVLALSGFAAEKTDIAETASTLNDDLMEFVGRDGTTPDLAVNAQLEERLYALEAEMREIAFKIPVAQLRSTIPDCVAHNRRGVLDLLDLMLFAELLGINGTSARIPSIDYLITLLCAVGEGQPPHDPVQLTQRLHELCERSGVDYDPRLPEIEAEFFHAADIYEADAGRENRLRALQQRKAELGTSYFAPQILRAIVTYNSALLQRIGAEAFAPQDCGEIPSAADEIDLSVSVFETPALPQITEALKRRATGGAPELSAIDRIAWCLDLDYPTAVERRVLRDESVDASDDLARTVILVGLLCRSSVVLEDEFPAIGLSAELLFDRWVPELSQAVQEKVNRGITGDGYREACRLSEIKTRYLYTSMAEMRRNGRGRMSDEELAEAWAAKKKAPTPERVNTAGSAKLIIQDAIANTRVRPREEARTALKWSAKRRLQAIVVAFATAAMVFAVGRAFLWNGDLSRFDRDELRQISPFLSRGARSEEGEGPAFVGRIRDNWSELGEADQALVATDLVEALQESGVRDVMIYDDDGLLRIQALGEHSPRIMPGVEPEP